MIGLVLFFIALAATAGGSSGFGLTMFGVLYVWWWKRMIRIGQQAKTEARLGCLPQYVSGPHRKGDR